MSEKLYHGDYDVIVVGAGHAGCEASHAAAKIGMKTLLLTINADNIALMPCNPSIGGPGKGHMVREIDALGGLMGKAIDDSYIQIRVLNDSRGPAVRALRAQADKKRYQKAMRGFLESVENLHIKMDEAVRIIADETATDTPGLAGPEGSSDTVSHGAVNVEGETGEGGFSSSAGGRRSEKGSGTKKFVVRGVETAGGMRYSAKAVILCTGVYLKSDIIIGEIKYRGGPHNEMPADWLSDSLLGYGFKIERLQTATPCRVDRASIDLSKFSALPYSRGVRCFSFKSPLSRNVQDDCYIAFSNEATVEVIKGNIHRSPLVIGNITNNGPRYCPSIDRKVINFPNKAHHQIFIEPEGEGSNEMYLQGLTTSMPPDVQQAILRTIPGLENIEIMRYGYAIEYDFLPPDQLESSLETKAMSGLYCAGQINGTSGYEEAAGQGIMAGINAAMKIEGRPQVVLSRSAAYIGVMIDDLVTKPMLEPYRMFTSRAEHRLMLGSESAHFRLSGIGRRVGLLDEGEYGAVVSEKRAVSAEIRKLRSFGVNPTAANNAALSALGESPLRKPFSAFEVLMREKVSYADLEKFGYERGLSDERHSELVSLVEIYAKYHGYIERELRQIERLKKTERVRIAPDFDYSRVKGLSKESREVLGRYRPRSLGQASRLQGVTPAEISLLMVYLSSGRQKKNE